MAMDWKRLGMVVGARQLVLMLFGSTLKNTNGRAFLPEQALTEGVRIDPVLSHAPQRSTRHDECAIHRVMGVCL